MGNAKVLLLVLVLAVSARTCRPWGEDVADAAKKKAEEAQNAAPAVVEKAKDKTETWANWAYDKFSETIGLKMGDGEHMAENQKISVGDTASSKAQDAISYGKDKTAEAYNEADEKIKTAKDRASQMAHNAKEKAADAVDKASKKASDAKEAVKEAANATAYKASDAKEEVKEKVAQATHNVGKAAKNTKDAVTEKAKSAKHKVSQPIGDL